MLICILSSNHQDITLEYIIKRPRAVRRLEKIQLLSGKNVGQPLSSLANEVLLKIYNELFQNEGFSFSAKTLFYHATRRYV